MNTNIDIVNEKKNDVNTQTTTNLLEVTIKEHAARYNTGKIDGTYITPEFLEGLSKVMEFGARKYTKENWRKGSPVRQILASIIRHTWEIQKGNDIDNDSGEPHWAHISANCMFLSEMMINGKMKENDDRYKRIKLDN